MKTKQKGNHYYTLVSKQALQDIQQIGMTEKEVDSFLEQFHDLGNYPDPCKCREIQAIQRRDVPDEVIRFKSAYPYCLCKYRGIVIIFEYQDTSKKPVLALVGIFVRDNNTYDSALTDWLRRLGVMG